MSESAHGGGATYTEQHEWKSGREIFVKAKDQGLKTPLVFAAAEKEGGLLY